MEDNNSILDDIKPEEVEASYFQRLFTNLADAAVEVIIIVGFYLFFPRDIILQLFAISPYMKYVIVLITIFLYRLICILLFNKTIGMLICRVKFLNGQLQPLSSKERVITVFVSRGPGIKYYKI